MATVKSIISSADKACDGFEKVVASVETKMFREAVTLMQSLELDAKGNVKTTMENLKRLSSIKAKLNRVAEDPVYKAAVTQFVQAFAVIQKQQNEYFSQEFPEKTLGENAKKRHEAMKVIAVENTIEGLSTAGVKANVTDKLNDMLLKAVTTGASFADLQEEVRKYLVGQDGGTGALTRYATTYSVTSLSQFTGQNNKLLTDDLGVEWFMYVGSTMERTREFCQHMTAKKWVHISEIPEILKGHIEYEGEVHKCKIYAKTKLPSGMIEGTNEDNFQVNVGGWNCRHQLVPVAAAAVPEEIRNKFETVKKPEPISEDLYKDKLAQFEEYLQNHKSGKVSANVAGIKKAAAEGNLDELNRHIAEAEATIAKNEASIKQKQEKAKMMKDKARLMKIDATKRIADGYIKDFKNIPGVDTSALKDAYKQGKWEDVRKEALKLALMKRSIIKQSMDAIKEANSLGGIDTSKLKSYLDARNLAKMQAETQNVANMVAKAKAAIDAMSDLFPNINTLRQQYSFSELEKAHKELDDVIQRWLSKYSYSSMDNAPLQHLKNKLLFELTNPTVRYSNPELIKKAIEEKMRLIDQQIEWNDLVTKVQSLKTFSTKLKAYKTALDKVDAALNSNDLAALRKAIDEAEKKQQEIVEKQIKRGGDTKTALNKEYKGGALGKDITPNVNAANMVSEDPYRGTYTNNIARMQGFDAPAKLVSESEFEMLAKACGEIFYRTVNPTNFKGKSMSSQEFASQLYVANLLELNGPGGRAYGDGMYVATASWDGCSTNRLTESRKQSAYYDSICYGNGQHTISEMTFTRKPKIIKQSELAQMWRNLTTEQKRKYGGTSSDYANTYGCALGYDAMYCSGPNYMVIWNRSIIAVKKQ